MRWLSVEASKSVTSQSVRSEEPDICPICRDTPRDIFITSCGHAFCGSCICHYLFFRAVHGGKQTCPACRQTVTWCITTTSTTSTTSNTPTTSTEASQAPSCSTAEQSPSLSLSQPTVSTPTHTPNNLGRTTGPVTGTFQLGRIKMQVDIHDANPLSRLCKLLRVTPDRIKLIHKGRRIQGQGPDLSHIIRSSKVPITLLPAMPGPKTGAIRLVTNVIWRLVVMLHELCSRACRPAWRTMHPWLSAWWSMYGRPMRQVLHALIMSVNPQWTAIGDHPRGRAVPTPMATET